MALPRATKKTLLGRSACFGKTLTQLKIKFLFNDSRFIRGNIKSHPVTKFDRRVTFMPSSSF